MSVFRLSLAGAVAALAAACGIGVIGGATITADDASAGDGAPLVDTGPSPADAAVGTAADAGLQATCRDLLAIVPGAASGVHAVDPDGPGGAPPFDVRCDMSTVGGGWTLVGRELANVEGTFFFLAADTQNPGAVAAGTESGLVGERFVGKYTEVWIDWSASSFIRFRRPLDFDLFANVYDSDVPVADATTSDPTLASWFQQGGGAKLCLASRESDLRPGETSWAVKPLNDNSASCGCNSGNWTGRGAYYGGAKTSSTACIASGGGWAGVKNTGEQKGGIVPTYETRLWIR